MNYPDLFQKSEIITGNYAFKHFSLEYDNDSPSPS